MTNNLKILTILSIFVFVLTGYFYFSSTSVKNQIIANSNKEENNKTTGINNEDGNKKDDEEKTSKLSILKIIIIVILIVIIIGVIVFIVNFIFVNKEEEAFKFNEESKVDFKKENFCSIFFAIDRNLLKKKAINEENFFEILARIISFEIFNFNEEEVKKDEEKLKINFLLGDEEEFNNNKDTYNFFNTIFLDKILKKISDFGELPDANFQEHYYSEYSIDNAESVDNIRQKYCDFENYLCAYLLYYLFETIGNNGIKVEIYNTEKLYLKEKTYRIIAVNENNGRPMGNVYDIKYCIINEILKKLINDNQLQNVTYKEF